MDQGVELTPPDLAAEIVGESEEGAIDRDLSGVGAHRRHLPIQHRLIGDHRGDEMIWFGEREILSLIDTEELGIAVLHRLNSLFDH